MTERSGDQGSQPEDVSVVEEESIHSFLDGEEPGPRYRGIATPDNPDFAEEVLRYIRSEEPESYDPDMGPILLEEAMKKDHSLDEVSVYEVKGFGDLETGLNVGVLYEIGYDFEAEARAGSV